MSIFSMLGPLSWGIAWLLFRLEAIWCERAELSNWIVAIFVAGMAEGFWAGIPLKVENINNCDPGSLLVGRLCSDERDTFIARHYIKKLCKKSCCKGDCRKAAVKASMWFAKGKDIQLKHIVDIIVKTNLMEAAQCRKNYRKAGKLAKEIINLLPECSQPFYDCAVLPCDFGFTSAAMVCARSIVSQIDGSTGIAVIDKGILLKHSDADMFYGAEAVARFIEDSSVQNPSLQLYNMIYEPELNANKQILLKHQIQSGACGWALLPVIKPQNTQYDRRPRICQKAIGKKYFLHICFLQIIAGIIMSVVKGEIFTFLHFFVGANVTILWSGQSTVHSYILHGLVVPIRLSILIVAGSFILFILRQVGPTPDTKIDGIIQTSLPVLGLIIWWIAYFIKQRYDYFVLGLGIFIFVLKFAFMIFGVIYVVLFPNIE
ncbi:hypothetical protein C1645_787785 [Glomus cerebriforme]|uniref:Uncharacterized protein n=1 Tax=Glomus cerebriforme TaxID=658196 RepID=A0A397SIR9_9GLOM|nr:hypothetical protein C1645_787785 [Glomus cerebriforme]